MTEYSRMAKGSFTAVGTASSAASQAVALPFVPDFVEVWNNTKMAAAAADNLTTRAWWSVNDPTNTYIEGYNASGVLQFDVIPTSGGITTFQGGLALQYGPLVLLGGSGGIAKTSSTVLTVTTTAAHGLNTGNWVTFQNLYETSTTGMQQIAGIPFLVTVTSSTVFTISWVGNSTNLTAITSGGYEPNGSFIAGFKQILYPVLYAPGIAVPWKITLGATTTVFTTAPHNFQVGQEIGFRIPTAWGTTQLNELPNNLIPGSPMYGYVTSVTNSTEFVCNINSTSFTAFNVNQPFTSFPGEKFPLVVAVGDVNSGGFPYTGGALYPSPTVFDQTVASTSTGRSTTNGPAIQGAYFNNTSQGFVIGTALSTNFSNYIMETGDFVYWHAYLHDVGLP